MQIKSFHFNPLQVNCYVCYDNSSKQAIIIDPACYSDFEYDQLFSFIEKEQLSITTIIITHPHFDHVIGAKQVCEKYDLPLTAHINSEHILNKAALSAASLGMPMTALPSTEYITHDNTINVGDEVLNILYTPGHCAGSICFVCNSDKTVFTGDVLFNGSIGRTDFETGDYATLINSINTKLLTLPDDYIVRSGHGGRTTIGTERINNPYLI